MTTDIINHPAHYVDQSVVIEPIDFCDMLPFCLGNALKYVFRAGHKDGASELQDLKKAHWYLSRHQSSPMGLEIEEDEQDNFYKLAMCLKFSKSELLRNAALLSDNYFTFWGYLQDNVRNRIVQLESKNSSS